MVASRIMSRIRGLAAMRAPRCAACSLHPMPDWLALSVACSELSSVNPGESLSRNLCPTSSKTLAAVHSENVVDSTDAKSLTEEGQFCDRAARVHTIARMTTALAKSWSAIYSAAPQPLPVVSTNCRGNGGQVGEHR